MCKYTLSLVIVLHAAVAVAGQSTLSPKPPALSPKPSALVRCASTTTTPATRRRSASASIAWCVEPLPWPGNPARPLDTTNRGKYFFEVVDAASGTVIYSRGFSSIYGEWETTAEAKRLDRTFSESLRFPAPQQPVRIVVKKRDARNVFRDVWTTTIDPADKFVAAQRRGRCRAADQAARERRSGDQDRSADPRRRLYRPRAREVRARRAAADRDAAGDLAVQGTPTRYQRLGPVAGVDAVRYLASVAGHLSALARRRDLRCIRLGALRPDVRQQSVPRPRRERAVRRRRDPDQQRDLRRRRHLRLIQHGRR